MYKKWDLEFKQRDPEGFRQYALSMVRKSRYGISSEWYQEQFIKQEGKCAICGKIMDRPFIDHDHVTGVARSLLCRKCNTVLGFVDESIEILRKTIQYLEKWK